MSAIEIAIKPDGSIAAIHNDAFTDLYGEGKTEIRRASHVEPIADGERVAWQADMSPVGGSILGPFGTRGEALEAEVAWLKEHGF